VASVNDLNDGLWLISRVQSRLCALALESVLETMRPLPIEPLAGVPEFVRGLPVIRGTPLPVIALAAGSLRQLQPLLRNALTGSVAAIGTLARQLPLALWDAGLVPEAPWAGLEAGEGRA
jgi:hypothetical protein